MRAGSSAANRRSAQDSLEQTDDKWAEAFRVESQDFGINYSGSLRDLLGTVGPPIPPIWMSAPTTP